QVTFHTMGTCSIQRNLCYLLANILSLLKGGFGTSLRRECVHFVIKHVSNASMVNMLDEWTEQSRFMTFELEIQEELLESLPQLLSVFPSVRARKLANEIGSVMLKPKV